MPTLNKAYLFIYLFIYYQHVKLDFYSATSLTQQSMGRQVAPHPDSVNQSLPLLINAMCLAEKQQILLVSSLARTGLESTIYQHATHYTTDAA